MVPAARAAHCPTPVCFTYRWRTYSLVGAVVQGVVSVVDPKTSWCAKWLHLK